MKYRKAAYTLIATLGIYLASSAVVMSGTGFGGLDTMNGYRLSQFGDFVKNWHFVTVRYRRDTGELRLVYANEKAWQALQNNATDYPDGAVFAKIGIGTEEDPGFTSSIVPSGAKRYQLMVMDHEKHKDTNGWGYALFDMNAKTLDEDPAIKTQACHACHAMVPERGYVFSQAMHLEIGMPAMDPLGQIPQDKLHFETVDTAALQKEVLKHFPQKFAQIRMLQGELRKKMFQGTIDEIRPALINEARKSGMPAALVEDGGSRFSLVYPQPDEKACTIKSTGESGTPFKAVFTVSQNAQSTANISMLLYCDHGGKATEIKP